MKILFIENRYKTSWWELIAKELEIRGHEVCFLIQNKRFKPNIENCYIIPYPKKFEFKNKVRFDLDKDNLMTSRLEAFANLELNNPAIYIDTDVLVVRPIPIELFKEKEVFLCNRAFSNDTFINTSFKIWRIQ